ncbi:tyrosine-protein phosphatase [Parasphingorhabdus pacifica]
MRPEDPAHLTAAGWDALLKHGVRTVVDLTEPDEDEPDRAPRPVELTTVNLPLDNRGDTIFWDRWDGPPSGTPLYYDAFLDRFSATIAEVVTAIAHARDGGVLVHCGAGRDRTGLVVLVLLALVGVSAEDIVADHSLSLWRLRPLFELAGRPDEGPLVEEYLAGKGVTVTELIEDVLTRDFAGYLRAAGVGDHTLASLRKRLVRAPS